MESARVDLDLTDISKCTTHPLSRLIKLFGELRPGESLNVKIRLDASPLDILLDKAAKKGVELEVLESSGLIAIIRVVKKYGDS